MPATREVLEHTSESALRVRASNWPELLAEAGRTLGALLWASSVPVPRGVGTWRHFELQAADDAALLVDWLNELLYHAEAEWWIPAEFVIEAATPQTLRARVRGFPVATAPASVKAATLYGARIDHEADDIAATVVLDV